MRTFATLSLTCCLIVVVVLQALTLSNQQQRESVIRFESVDDAMPVVETAAYTVDAEEDIATTAEIETPEPLIEIPAANSTDPLPTLVPRESPPAFELSDASDGTSEPVAFEKELPAPFVEPNPASADPFTFTQPGYNAPPVLTGPVSPSKTTNTLSVQPAQGQGDEQPESPAELARYPIWLLIKPDGVQFLQTEEEIATHFHSIPPNAFLLGCQSASFEAGPAEDNALRQTDKTSLGRAFQLGCKDFVLKGTYGTKQQLEVTGSSLDYSTESEQVLLKGTEESSLEYLSVDDSAATRLQAEEIVLQLHNDRFQMSAKGATGVEINPNPQQHKPARQQNSFDPFPEGA